jgi:chromosome partitioning protein
LTRSHGRTICVASHKGGVGKTTTVASLGVAMADRGLDVLLVDLDPQACLTFSLGLDPEVLELSLQDVLLERVPARMAVHRTEDGPKILPATADLTGCESVLRGRAGREYALKQALADVAPDYDVVLVDCPPSLGVLTVNALTAADELLIPLQCETLAYRGVGQLMDTVADVSRLTNPELVILGVLPTLYDGRTQHARAVLGDVTARYGLKVLEPPIPRSIRFAEAPAEGRSILRTRERTPGVQAYRELAGWLVGERPAPGALG